MSTRGAIARPAGDGWEGRYHHFDSYPTGLGKTLWLAYHGHFKRDVTAMQKYLIDSHPAGWSSIVDADLSKKPGFLDPGKRGAYDAGHAPATCYCHGDRHEEPSEPLRCTGECGDSCDPLFIEWAYVLADEGMSIWAAGPKSDHQYAHYPITFLRWSDPEPDWVSLEAARDRLYPAEAPA